LTFDASQIVQVIITGIDNPNYYGAIHTGSLAFTFSYVESGTFFDIKVFPGSRPGGDFSNIGILKFYDASKNFVASGAVTTNSS